MGEIGEKEIENNAPTAYYARNPHVGIKKNKRVRCIYIFLRTHFIFTVDYLHLIDNIFIPLHLILFRGEYLIAFSKKYKCVSNVYFCIRKNHKIA